MTEIVQEKLNIKSIEANLKYMTDEEWQEKLILLRLHIKPVQDTKLSRYAVNTYIIGRRWSLTDNEYGGNTQDAWYCKYVNDVLKQIQKKRGKVDHCYKVYQICDLLKFEPSLNARLIHNDDTTYFEVWLDKVDNNDDIKL